MSSSEVNLHPNDVKDWKGLTEQQTTEHARLKTTDLKRPGYLVHWSPIYHGKYPQ